MTALTRMALACGAALVMATAALGGLHSSDRDPAISMLGEASAPARREVFSEPEMPSASELELGSLPGVWATR